MKRHSTKVTYPIRLEPGSFAALERLAARLDLTWRGMGNVSALFDRLRERYETDPDAVVDLLRTRSRGRMADHEPPEEAERRSIRWLCRQADNFEDWR